MKIYFFQVEPDYQKKIMKSSQKNEEEVEKVEFETAEQIEKISLETPAFLVLQMSDNENLAWEYIRRLRERKLNLVILFIMKTKDLDLLYEANASGVHNIYIEDYSKRKFEEILENCHYSLKRYNKMQRNLFSQEEHAFRKRQQVMKKIMQNALEKPEEVEFLLPEINKRYGINLGPNNYQVIVISVNRADLYGKDSEFLKKATLLALFHLSSAREMIFTVQNPYGLIGLINYPEDFQRKVKRKEFERLLEAIQTLDSQYGDFRVTIGVGSLVQSITEMEESLRKAALVQEFRMFSGANILYADDIMRINIPLSEFIPEPKLREMRRYVTLGDVPHLRKWFQEFYKTYEKKFRNYPPAYAKLCWESFLAVRHLEKNSAIHMFPEWKFFQLQHIFEGLDRMHQLENLLMEVCHMMRGGASGEQELAMHAIAYMKVHFAEPLTLETIADNCGVSTSYFSRKFKEQAGENYIDVLTDIRMKEAVNLLETTDMSIMEILENVGYCDDKHFRKLFVKHIGQTPREYRKKFLSDKEKTC